MAYRQIHDGKIVIASLFLVIYFNSYLFKQLVRRVTRQIFFALHRTNWQQDKIKMFTQKLESTVLNIEEVPIGLIMHFNELYLDEIAKVLLVVFMSVQ